MTSHEVRRAHVTDEGGLRTLDPVRGFYLIAIPRKEAQDIDLYFVLPDGTPLRLAFTGRSSERGAYLTVTAPPDRRAIALDAISSLISLAVSAPYMSGALLNLQEPFLRRLESLIAFDPSADPPHATYAFFKHS